MKIFFQNLKEVLRSGYKFYFYFWIGSIILFSLTLFFLLKEIKYFLALQESKKKIEESFQRIQPQVISIKETLKAVDWQRSFIKETLSLSIVFDLTDLKKTLHNMKKLSQNGDTFFVLQEMTLKREEDNPPTLLLKGEKIKFY